METMTTEHVIDMVDDRLSRIIYHIPSLEHPSIPISPQEKTHILSKSLILEMTSGITYRFIHGMEFDQSGLDVVANPLIPPIMESTTYMDVTSLPCWQQYTGQRITGVDFGWQDDPMALFPSLYANYVRLIFETGNPIIVCLLDYHKHTAWSLESSDAIMVIFDDVTAKQHLAAFNLN